MGSGKEGEFFPIDFRVFAPDADGKTKNDHFLEMLLRAKSDKRLKANTVLFDSWYASVDNLKVIHRLGMVFVTTLKSNRLVSTSKAQYAASKEQNKDKQAKHKGYVHLDTLDWDPSSLRHGARIKLKELPFLVRLSKQVAQTATLSGSSPTVTWNQTTKRRRVMLTLGSPRTSFKTRTPCAGRSSSYIGNSGISSGLRNASAAPPAPSATIWPAVIWPG